MRRTNLGNGRGGPLMTDHLQDLELELELLKRKRQLIQQQQNEMLFRNSAASRSTYSQPPQLFENRYNEAQRHNFSNLYDEAPRERPSALKRRAPPVWANAPADRSDAPLSSFKRPRPGPNPGRRFNQTPDPPSHGPHGIRRQPPPLLDSPKLNYAPAPFQPNFKRNFKPNPNKAGAAPKAPEQRRNFKPTSPRVEHERKRQVLSTAESSQKVNGRLELALGNIVKQIKAAHPESVHLFASPALARLMKQGIRERVRAAMAGRAVGAVPTVVQHYREAFPPHTDLEILELASIKTPALSESAELAIQLLEEGDPEQYFKKNVKRLMEVKLDEMFEKMEKLYKAEGESEIIEHLPEVKKSHEDVEGFRKRRERLAADKQEGDAEKDQTQEKAATAVLPKHEEYDKWISMFIEWRLPRLLPKYKDYIINLLDLDKMYCATRAAIVLKTNNKGLQTAVNKEQYSINSETSKDDPKLPRNLPYFVKVQAVPSMPKRKLMQEFLNTFNPKTIKRHKKNYNLLFVGFADKADYDNILAASKTKIGNSTINIVGNNNPKSTIFDADSQKRDDEAVDEVLTPQLDDQIDDLLSSIRKADEEAKETEPEINSKADAVVENKQEDNAEDAKNDIVDLETENGHDSDIEEVKADDSETVTVEDDDPVSEKDVVAPLKSDEAKADANKEAEANEEAEANKDVEANKEAEANTNKKEEAFKEADATAKGTPAKSRAPATPSTIRTRRASRLAQNN